MKQVTLNAKRLKQLLTTKLTKSSKKTQEFLDQLIGESGGANPNVKPVHIPRRVWKQCGQILAEQAYVVI